MKRIIFVIILVVTAVIFQSCKKEEIDMLVKEPVIIQLNDRSKKLVASSSIFGIELFKKVAVDEQEDKNWMISPLSVSLALAMTYNGANNDTKAAMQNTLGFDELTDEQININFQQLTELLLGIDPLVETSIANSIWYRNTFSVLDDFITTNESFYDAEVSALDFSSPSAKDVINSWVADETNNKIEGIVDNINPETVMFLINAIYFKGTWKYAFDKAENYNRDFNYEDGTSGQVEMMSQTASLKAFTNEYVNIVELPYGQGNWVMDLLLPVGSNTANDVIELFSNENWENWINNLSEPYNVTISLPPFKFDYNERLNEELADLGMGIAFEPSVADFTLINEGGQLYISEVKHKSFIEVNEVGTEAAAVTSVEVSYNSADGGGVQLIFDKPFLFVIREVSSGAMLFMGKVGYPER